MNHETLENINLKAKHGFFALVSRSAVIYCFKAVSILLLSRWLAPSDYAIFAVLQGLVWSVNLFLPDLSLSIPLTQQKENPSKVQMRSLYGLVTYRGLLLFFIFVLFGSYIINHYKYDDQYYSYLLILSFVLFIESIKIPPQMMLDRNLEFSKVMKIELTESLAMYIVQITCAFKGFGAWSFAYALLTRSIVGLVLSFYYCPYFFLPKLYKNEIKKLFNFAFLSELKKMIVAAKTMIVPLLLANFLTPNVLGVYVWSIGIVSIPSALTDSFDRVFFPAFSKMQDNSDFFKQSFAKNINSFLVFLGLMYVLIICCSSSGVKSFFPDKWDFAIEIIPLAALGTFLSKVRYLFGTLMNSRAMPGILLKVESLALFLEVVLAIPVLYFYDLIFYLYLIIMIESIICVTTYFLNSDFIHLSVVRRFFSILCAHIFLYSLFKTYIFTLNINSWLLLILSFLLSSFLYIVILFIIDRNSIQEFKIVFSTLARKI